MPLRADGMGRRLRDLRTEFHVTVNELADCSGISASTIRRIEAAGRYCMVDYNTRNRLAAAFLVQQAWLQYGRRFHSDQWMEDPELNVLIRTNSVTPIIGVYGARQQRRIERNVSDLRVTVSLPTITSSLRSQEENRANPLKHFATLPVGSILEKISNDKYCVIVEDNTIAEGSTPIRALKIAEENRA